MMYQFWITVATPGQMSENDAMQFFNATSEATPEWELVTIDPMGRAIYRRLKED